MRRMMLMGLAIAAGLVQVGLAPPEEPGAKAEAPPQDVVVAELLEAHNRERAKESLNPLTITPKLNAAALVQARDMAEHGKMAHEGSDGSTPAQRVERQAYKYQATGENVAYGQPTTEDVMKGWMNSPHHRDNILGKFTEMGAARVESEDETPYWCVVFGTPLPQLDPQKAAADLVDAINRAREEAKVDRLEVGEALAEAAQAEARRLAAQGSLKDDAQAKEQANPLEPLARSQGRRYKQLSLSVSSGYPGAAEVVKSLLESPEQKRTLLGPFDEIGVGYSNAENGTPFWCLIFGSVRR